VEIAWQCAFLKKVAEKARIEIELKTGVT